MITNQTVWDSYVEKNQDAYGGCCVKIARRVMEILDAEVGLIKPHDLICRAEKDVEEDGITGFMAGAIAQIVSQCHSRGDEFRQAWNKGYNVDESKAKGGIVFPAIIEIGIPEKQEASMPDTRPGSAESGDSKDAIQ